MQRTNKPAPKPKRTAVVRKPLSVQVKAHTEKPAEKQVEFEGDMEYTVSTGSTLLDLAISGGRKRGGGIPSRILVEVFGPSGSGKTVLLCEIAGGVQRAGGNIMFNDPEARLNKQFARMFDLNTDSIEYTQPDTVTEVFKEARAWQPKGKGVNGIFTDSLAALSTEMEMGSDDGDKMGMRRAKEFSEQLRKTARVLAQNNWLMVCSNQVRQNADAGTYGEKYTTPGGVSIGFYASLRLRFKSPEKIYQINKVAGKEVKRVIGVKSEVEVYKSSIWKPYRTAPVTILFDYGIDDIRANLQFIKDYTKNTTYCLGDSILAVSMEEAIELVESSPEMIKKLRDEVIDLWECIEAKFSSERKPKQR